MSFLMIILFAVIVFGAVSFIFFGICLTIRQNERKAKETASCGGSESIYEPEYETIEVQATVVDLRCTARLVGMKTPKSVKEFSVVLRDKDGTFRNFLIPEEMYEGLEIGQTGLLTIVDGEFYGFALEETP